ncbi:MAG: LCP family protein [Candidatus Pacebacteria bacterium]|nr:LCP family protein [Candidatus Paceibacterota bacterium]
MEPVTFLSPENTQPSKKKFLGKLPEKKYIILAVLIVIGLFYLIKSDHQFSINNPFSFRDGTQILPLTTPDPDYAMPDKDPNRIDVLVLGIRGLDDANASDGGPLLTDSIQVFSYDKTTKKSSLISIPRDLFVTIHDREKAKLNSAYEYGLSHSSNSLQFIKDKISQITGTYIDQVVVFDFSSFKEIVDSLGGIDVTLVAPFTETQQWGASFSLPAGLNHLDGQSALYYARSRYTSSDFDRSRRQQQIIFAIKDKLMKLNFLGDPLKSFSVLTTVRSHVKTDIGVWNINEFISLANQLKMDQIKKTVISTENLVVDSKENGAYILLPKVGNFSEIKKLFQDSLK